MSEKKKLERLITPVGEAKWAHVHTPKKPYMEKGEPKYQIDVVFEATDPAWQAWGADVMAKLKALPTQKDKDGKPMAKQMPIKKEVGEDDKPTGRFFVTFKTGSKFKPGLFDRFGKEIPENVLIGNGSKVKVNYSPDTFDAFGGGLVFYLNAVQVLELVEYKPSTADAYGFTSDTPADEVQEENPFAK